MTEQFNPDWPHVIYTHDELYAAIDQQLINVDEIGQMTERLGGTVPYLLAQVLEGLKNMDLGSFTATLGKEQNYRGSGSYIPIEVKDGDTLVHSFRITTALSSGYPPESPGIMHLDIEGVKRQLLRALSPGSGGEVEE